MTIIRMLKWKTNEFLLADFIQIASKQSLYLAVMTGGARGALLKNLYDLYIHKLLFSPYFTTVKFYGMGKLLLENDIIQSMYVDCPVWPDDISRNHLCGKFMIAIRDFIYNSTCWWFLRICDDAIMNWDAFGPFYHDLTQQFNPLNGRFVQGDCIYKRSKTYAYLQGGSGYILSRYSAIEFEKDHLQFKLECDQTKNDDVSFGSWLSYSNYSRREITSRFFVGHQFQGYRQLIDLLRNTSTIPDCQVIKNRHHWRICRPFFTNLKNVVVWHEKNKSKTFFPLAQKFFSQLPGDLYFFQNSYKGEVCRSEYNIEGFWN